MFDFCIVFLFSILCILCFFYCYEYYVSFCAVSFPFLYKTTDHFHRLEIQLQSINIIIIVVITVGFTKRRLQMAIGVVVKSKKQSRYRPGVAQRAPES